MKEQILTSVNTKNDKRNFDVDEVRADFPILQRLVNGRPLVYLDNAATTQKPNAVIENHRNYYESENANIHRGLYFLSEVATDAYETARLKAKEFINAMSASEVIFKKELPKELILFLLLFVGQITLKRVMKLFSRKWNIIPILYLGN